jgi:hypothetical protein
MYSHEYFIIFDNIIHRKVSIGSCHVTRRDTKLYYKDPSNMAEKYLGRKVADHNYIHAGEGD